MATKEKEKEKQNTAGAVTESRSPATAGDGTPPAGTTEIERRGTGPAMPPVRERRKYKVRETPPPPPPPPKLNDYEPIIGKAAIDELHFLARHLRGKTVKMVNSTAVGGGVAEILNRLIPLMNELEVPTKWEVITGGNDFFEITKGFHNALHGGEYNVTREILDLFQMYNEQNRQRMEFAEDLFVIHDPQPVGVIQAYKLAKKYVDCQLVLAGGGATDDPEGAVVLAEVMEAAGDDPDVIILNLPPWSALEINALQQASNIVIQKSLKEGFGLTVTEALWKGKPVIAGAVGGIPTQVVHKLTGVLVHSVEGCAYQIRYLLTHPEFAQQLGRNGQEHVKENFLITSNIKRWLILFQLMLGMARPQKVA